MNNCWLFDPEDRPTFSELSSTIESLLSVMCGYIELGMALQCKSSPEEVLGRL